MSLCVSWGSSSCSSQSPRTPLPHFYSGELPTRCHSHSSRKMFLDLPTALLPPQPLILFLNPKCVSTCVCVCVSMYVHELFLLPPQTTRSDPSSVPTGTSKTCPACFSQPHCRDITCPGAQDSCLFSRMQLGGRRGREGGGR